MVVADLRIFRDAAGEGNDPFAVLFRQLGNTNGGLAHYRLGVQPTFTGDDNICIFDVIF